MFLQYKKSLKSDINLEKFSRARLKINRIAPNKVLQISLCLCFINLSQTVLIKPEKSQFYCFLPFCKVSNLPYLSLYYI